MKYGYFDKENKEYVITRPDTPKPWVNYLGSPLYGAIISNNAGGYSFAKSGAKGRILRYRFNNDDKPGRYIYMREDSTGDYWSASWQPVGKNEGYKSCCRHGLGYTSIESEYQGILSETTYFVPLNQNYEIWKHRIKNITTKEKNISIFGYAEFTNDSDYEQDSVNLQYSQFISKTYFKTNKIVQSINENSKGCQFKSFSLVGSPVVSYTGDKRSFIGNYGSYSNPKSVVEGKCENTLNYNINSCGALHTQLHLNPGEEKEILFILGMQNENEADIIISKYNNFALQKDIDLKEIKKYWHNILKRFKVETPDENFNNMINIWNAYQCLITFTWSRAASFIYCGHRNGFGYRDTVQDIQGVIHLAPKMAKKQLIFMISAQVDNGGCLPLVKYNHAPGYEDTPDNFSYRADDALWLFPTVRKFIAETGDLKFLDEIVPYANKGEDTVYNHLKKAIDFSMNRLGTNGLPAGLYADWNDCLRLGENGESTFVSMQLFYALNIIKEFANIKRDYIYAKYLSEQKINLSSKIDNLCFEEDRYIRGITENNLRIGSKNNKEASMWLNPQSWAVISGLADKNKTKIILDNVYTNLNTPFGAKLMTPPYKKHGFPGALSIVYNPSTKENGSIFLQPQGWLILAEALAGHGNRAFEYYKESSPAYQNDIAEIREMEPYVYGQFTESVESPFEGRSHVHWLTGTASTVMVGCLEGILGLRPDINGLLIEPSIPSHWKNVKIEKIFRGKKLIIKIENNGKECVYKEVYLNNIKLKTNYILANQLKEINEILFIM
ncbi:GH36-type glycosyl hydrolase domain-containing protein [Sedimentibacter sp. MB31-C6]|uniref:GH36-type glycosyl hydrolase domain-containing protein n=1 Tax=Sedimentibacter sp. MB31-C6 TaxID=3109366 RepID=UPI002DDCB968|nr:N,N'-diacetylchitobiose phosphorylase [Sedimentibacter sp. MB36-C1]WSI03680.1 N,N'-diacetylchitobiose phosphorylase [Sedimentibacter sp. MB36-C1]